MGESTRNLYVSIASGPLALFADNDDENIAIAFLGESVEYSFRDAPLGTIVCAVSRQPAGATAMFTGGTIAPDAIGEHRHTATNASAATTARRTRLVIFPVAAKTDFRLTQPNRIVGASGIVADPQPRSEAQVRATLRMYVLELVRSHKDLTVLDALTTNNPLPAGVEWRNYMPS